MKKEEDYIYFFHPKIKKYEYESLNTENLDNVKYNNTKKNNYIDNYTTIANSIKEKILPKIKIKNNYEREKKSVKLPLLIDKNNISTFEKRKNYKVIMPEKKIKKNNKSIDELNIEETKKENYKDYFMKKSIRRKQKLNRFLDEINNSEDRYNKEIPNIDSDLTSNDKMLMDNRWKNSFYLDEYQHFFMKNLKGKISSMNYRQMIKKFGEISTMCFSPGNGHYIPKKINYLY